MCLEERDINLKYCKTFTEINVKTRFEHLWKQKKRQMVSGGNSVYGKIFRMNKNWVDA